MVTFKPRPQTPGSEAFQVLSRIEQDQQITEHLATNDYFDEATGDLYRPDVLPPDDDPDD